MKSFYQLIPKDEAHLSRLLSFLLIGRETELAIRNNGYLSIIANEKNLDVIKYVKNEMNTEIREANYFPSLQENIFFSNYPKYFFNSFFPFILETAMLTQLGDTIIIKTEKFRTFHPLSKMLYGDKLKLTPYRMSIFLPFLVREYVSRDGKQRLTMGRGHKMVVIQNELMTFLKGE